MATVTIVYRDKTRPVKKATCEWVSCLNGILTLHHQGGRNTHHPVDQMVEWEVKP